MRRHFSGPQGEPPNQYMSGKQHTPDKKENGQKSKRTFADIAKLASEASLAFSSTSASVSSEVKKKKKCLFDPDGPFIRKWEIVILVVMVFTTFVTPFEVAFILDSPLGLVVTNIVVDGIFIADIFFTFFLPYHDRQTGLLVTSHKRITLNYLKGWFLFDFIPVIPFDLIGLILIEADNSSGNTVDKLKSLRILRVLKLLKILRLFRARKIWARWRNNLPFRYATITLIQFLLMILVFSHWLACIFKIIPELERTTELDLTPEELDLGLRPVNWITKYFEDGLGLLPSEYDKWSVYIASFYWAVMTLTTVGYGDVNCATDGERIALSLFMLVGAILYAYIVAAVCGIFSNLSSSKSEFYNELDDLNSYVRNENIPPDLARRLRGFFIYADSKRESEQYMSLFSKLSPSLKEEVSAFHNRAWVEQVPFVRLVAPSEREEFIIALSVLVQVEVFPPSEVLLRPGSAIEKLFIVKKGIVLLHSTSDIPDDPEEEFEKSQLIGQILYRNSLPSAVEKTNGACFGNEIIYDNVRGQYYATTLTFCETHTLMKEDLKKLLEQRNFVESQNRINAHCGKNKSDSIRGTVHAETLSSVATIAVNESFQPEAINSEVRCDSEHKNSQCANV